jgi:hypothetical protein
MPGCGSRRPAQNHEASEPVRSVALNPQGWPIPPIASETFTSAKKMSRADLKSRWTRSAVQHAYSHATVGWSMASHMNASS